jgi:hypothetical protein
VTHILDIKLQSLYFYLSQKVDKDMGWLLMLLQIVRGYYTEALHVYIFVSWWT